MIGLYSVAKGQPPGWRKPKPNFYWAAWFKSEPSEPESDPFVAADAFGGAQTEADAVEQATHVLQSFGVETCERIDASWARADNHYRRGHLPWPKQRTAAKKAADAEFEASIRDWTLREAVWRVERERGDWPWRFYKTLSDAELQDMVRGSCDTYRRNPTERQQAAFELGERTREAHERFRAHVRQRVHVVAFSLHGENPYAVLGVAPGASERDVRAAYRRLAFETHPDRGGDVGAFRRVQRAFETLRGAQ